MEDNEKVNTSPHAPDNKTPTAEDMSKDPQHYENDEADPGEEHPPEKPKKFFERHPQAKNILQGAGVAAIFGSLLFIIKSLSHGNAPEDTATHSDKSTHPEASTDEPCSADTVVSDDASTSVQCQEEVEYKKVIGTVTGHLMKLAKGKHASEEKIQEAHENGFKDVPDGFTYRSEHPKEYQTRK